MTNQTYSCYVNDDETQGYLAARIAAKYKFGIVGLMDGKKHPYIEVDFVNRWVANRENGGYHNYLSVGKWLEAVDEEYKSTHFDIKPGDILVDKNGQEVIARCRDGHWTIQNFAAPCFGGSKQGVICKLKEHGYTEHVVDKN